MNNATNFYFCREIRMKSCVVIMFILKVVSYKDFKIKLYLETFFIMIYIERI